MKTKSKMDLLAHLMGNDHAGKAGKAGAAKAAGHSQGQAGAPDFSGMLSGLLKSQLGTGKTDAAPAKGVSALRGEGGKRSEPTRVSKETDRKEHAGDGDEQASGADVTAALMASVRVADSRAKSAAPLEGPVDAAAKPAAEGHGKNRDVRSALLGGDLAAALAALPQEARGAKDDKGARKGDKAGVSGAADKDENVDPSMLFERPHAGTRAGGTHGVLDKSQAELSHQKGEPLAALNAKREGDSTDELKAKAKTHNSQMTDALRMELPNSGEAKVAAPAAPTATDFRSEVLAPDPTAADLNIRGGVQGQSAKLVVDAGQGLGELELHLRVRQGVASVRIEGESAATMVAGRTDELRRSVESQGLTLGSIEVARPAADAPISNAANLMQARADQGDRSGGQHRERMETRLEEGTARGQPARVSQTSPRSRTGDGTVDVQA